MVNRFRQSVLSVRDQLAWVKQFHSSFDGLASGGTLRCVGWVQPTPLNQIYRVEIRYIYKEIPTAKVRDPELRRRVAGERIPHTYADDEPCLYLPGKRDWGPEKKIAMTIIPWLSVWLFYYEAWLGTGEWQGGGVHPIRES